MVSENWFVPSFTSWLKTRPGGVYVFVPTGEYTSFLPSGMNTVIEPLPAAGVSTA